MDWIPGVSQVKSLVQVCCGDVEGARRTQDNFSKQCPIVSQCRSAAEAAFVSSEAAAETQVEFLGTMKDAATATPGLGHVIGVGQFIAGDAEGGSNSMKAASRTTGVVLAGAGGFVVGGPVGAAAAGVAGGAFMDSLTTGIDSAIHQEFRPSGAIAAIDHAIKLDSNGDPISGAIFDVVAGVVGDAVAGYGAGKVVEKVGNHTLPAEPRFREHHINRDPGLRLDQNPRRPAANTAVDPAHAYKLHRLQVHLQDGAPVATPRGQLLETTVSRDVKMRHAQRGVPGNQKVRGRPIVVRNEQGGLRHWHGVAGPDGTPISNKCMAIEPLLPFAYNMFD